MQPRQECQFVSWRGRIEDRLRVIAGADPVFGSTQDVSRPDIRGQHQADRYQPIEKFLNGLED
jgi:hypothetical protein